MKKTREIRGMPVLALQEGERLGQVRDFILDPGARKVVALILDRRVGGEDQIVATANIRSIGPAAITVEDRSSLLPLSRIPRFQELARMGKPIYGKAVMSEDGARLGKVEDLEIDPEGFGFVTLVLKGVLGRGQVIPADRVRTIGADAIVVCAEAPQGVAPAPVPTVVVEPAPAPVPTPVVEPAPAPVPTPVVEPVPPALEETSPPPEPPAPPPAEPDAAPAVAEAGPPEPGEGEGPPAEEGENAWQRWVRRLKNG